jgi:hypothetical protein
MKHCFANIVRRAAKAVTASSHCTVCPWRKNASANTSYLRV